MAGTVSKPNGDRRSHWTGTVRLAAMDEPHLWAAVSYVVLHHEEAPSPGCGAL
jgi:hypothetical protein